MIRVPIAVQVAFELDNRPKALLPEVLRLQRLTRQRFALQDLGLHANDEYLFIVRAVEDADLSAFGQAARGTP
jgi:hypothetical protein